MDEGTVSNMGTADVLVPGRIRGGRHGTSRRGFIKRVITVAAGGALFSAGYGDSSVVQTQLVPGSALRRSLFATRVGDAFRVQGDSVDPISLRLVEVRDLGPASSAGTARDADREQSFLIQFSGPSDRPLEQQIYRFEHTSFGAFLLFIVPMAPDPDVQYYEAIFNRRQG